MEGIARTVGTKPMQKAPLLPEHLRQAVASLPPNLLGTRGLALLLMGFSGAFRRSELVALDVAASAFTEEGVTVLGASARGSARQVCDREHRSMSCSIKPTSGSFSSELSPGVLLIRLGFATAQASQLHLYV
jgi:hypothetical protein